MRDFFKPWRRKLGVVTLGVALALTVEWMRSLAVADIIYESARRTTFDHLAEIPKSAPAYEPFLPHKVFSDIRKEVNLADAVLQLPLVAISTNGSVVVVTNSESGWLDCESDCEFPALTTSAPFHIDEAFGETFKWRSHNLCFRFGTDQNYNAVWTIQYWSIVLPLTLLSAWLLLSKPRPAKKAEPSLPPEHDHA